MSKIIEFEAPIQQAPEYKNGAYIKIPFDVEQTYGKKRVKIIATFDGVKYQGSLVRMGSPDHILIIRKDIREQIGKSFGDMVKVSLKEDTSVRKVKVPKDFQELLKAQPAIHTYFKKLSYTHQKEYVEWIEEAKRAETRQRRMHKALQMMREGRKGR